MKLILVILFSLSSVMLSAQNSFELTYTPFINDATISDNVKGITLAQTFQLRYVRNHLLLDVGMESLHFSDNAFVINQSTNSIAFPRKGNLYELSYLVAGVGYRSVWFKKLHLDYSFLMGLLMKKSFTSATPTSGSTTITANRSGKDAVQILKPSLQTRLSYEYVVTNKLSASIGAVLQSNFSPVMKEEQASTYFLSNKTVDVYHQLGVSVSVSYFFR